MDQEAQRFAVVFDLGDHPIGRWLRNLDRSARFVDVPGLIGDPQAEFERRIAQRSPQLTTEPLVIGWFAQFGDKVRDRCLRPPPSQQVDEKQGDEEGDDCVVKSRIGRSRSQFSKAFALLKASTAANDSAANKAGCAAFREGPADRTKTSNAATATSSATPSVSQAPSMNNSTTAAT